MLFPHHLNPPILEIDTPPLSGIGNHWHLHPPFPPISLENLPETNANKIPCLPRKYERAYSPLCVRVGGGGAIKQFPGSSSKESSWKGHP